MIHDVSALLEGSAGHSKAHHEVLAGRVIRRRVRDIHQPQRARGAVRQRQREDALQHRRKGRPGQQSLLARLQVLVGEWVRRGRILRVQHGVQCARGAGKGRGLQERAASGHGQTPEMRGSTGRDTADPWKGNAQLNIRGCPIVPPHPPILSSRITGLLIHDMNPA